MATKTFKTRIKLKYDLQNAWENPGSFSALHGEMLLGHDTITVNSNNVQRVFANVGVENGAIKPLSILTKNVWLDNTTNLTAKLTAIDNALGEGGSVVNQINAAIAGLQVDAFELAKVNNGNIVISGISEANGEIAAATSKDFTIAVVDTYSESNPLVAQSYVDGINTSLTNSINTKANQSDLTDLEGRVGAAETKIDANNEAIGENAEAISGLTGRVETAESEIDALQTLAGGAVQSITGDEKINVSRTDNTVTLSHKTVTPTDNPGDAIAVGIGESKEINIPFISFDTTGHIENKGTQKVTITIPDAEDLGLSNALHFLGVTSTPLTDGETTNHITIGGQDKTAVNGDVVLDGDKKEFVFDGTTWHELGDASANTTAISEINDKIADMDFSLTGATNKTITTLTQTDGKITAATASYIAIPTSQVTTLGGYTAVAGNSTSLTEDDSLNAALGKLERGIAINKTNISANTTAIATLNGSGEGSVTNTVNTAIDALDGSAGIASVANGVVTLKAGVAQANGKISNSEGADITLAKVATTGAAEDVSYNNTTVAAAIAANTQAIAANTQAIEANDSEIATLQGRMTTAEADIAEINDWVLILDCGTADLVTHTEATNA